MKREETNNQFMYKIKINFDIPVITYYNGLYYNGFKETLKERAINYAL